MFKLWCEWVTRKIHGKFQLKVKEIDFSNGNAPDHFKGDCVLGIQ